MPEAIRVGDLTAHGTPVQGQGSPDVFIGNMKAWRAIPADVGGGLEEASKQVKAIMDKFPSLPSPSDPAQVATKDLTEIFQKMLDTATKAESASGMCGAMAGVQSAFMSFQPTALGLLATYTSASAAPGAEPGARLAFTAAFQAGLGAAMSAAVTAIAGSWDMNNCPATIPGPPPHGPGLVTVGCKTIFINKMPPCSRAIRSSKPPEAPTPSRWAAAMCSSGTRRLRLRRAKAGNRPVKAGKKTTNPGIAAVLGRNRQANPNPPRPRMLQQETQPRNQRQTRRRNSGFVCAIPISLPWPRGPTPASWGGQLQRQHRCGRVCHSS